MQLIPVVPASLGAAGELDASATAEMPTAVEQSASQLVAASRALRGPGRAPPARGRLLVL
jgi:hypothetical protein